MIDPMSLRADPAAAGDLPRRGWRDHVNRLRLDAKFIWPPFRAYYKYRVWRYATRRTPELGLARHLVDRRRAAVDVGANLGLFCRVLAERATEVFAFEPNPYPLRYLLRVADANVHVLQAAASDETGEAELSVPRTPRGWSSNGARLDDGVQRDDARVRVPVVRLDDLDLPPVGFLKIDVEGGEIRVLRGAQALIARDRPALFVENEIHHAGEAARAVFDFVLTRGYEGFCLTPDGLRHLSWFEDALDQGARRHGDAGYVKNFIFIPRRP